MTTSCCRTRWRFILCGRRSGRHLVGVMLIYCRLCFLRNISIIRCYCRRLIFRMLFICIRGSFIMCRNWGNRLSFILSRSLPWRNISLVICFFLRMISLLWNVWRIVICCISWGFAWVLVKMASFLLSVRKFRRSRIWSWGRIVPERPSWLAMERRRRTILVVESSFMSSTLWTHQQTNLFSMVQPQT